MMNDELKMTAEQNIAYQWALTHHYDSVAARYAKLLANYIANTRTQPNNPLSLAELKQMNGEPVWIEFFTKISRYGKFSGWAIVNTRFESQPFMDEHNLKFSYYGKSWKAYAHKPEQEGAK